MMRDSKLERCQHFCCLYVDEKPVARPQYDESKRMHPGCYPGTKVGGRNAIMESIIACRKVQ